MAAAVAAAASLSACTTDLASLVGRERVPPAAVVPLDDRVAVAARTTAGGVEVVAFRRDGSSWTATVIGGLTGGGPGANTVDLFGWEGDTGEAWNTFVFGSAEASVSRVTLEGLPAHGGRVIDGAWVIALRERGIEPQDLHWRFVDAVGAVVTEGTGIRLADTGPAGAIHRR